MNLNLFYAKSKNGQLLFSNNRALENYLYSVEGKNLVVTIGKEKSVRSHDQNRYYWFFLRLIANDTGNSEDELHQLFKRIFLPPVFKTILGREVKIPRTTTDLSKTEFGEYLDKISAETGIPLPDPKDIKNLIELSYPTEELGEQKF